jgi:hypothetical protein
MSQAVADRRPPSPTTVGAIANTAAAAEIAMRGAVGSISVRAMIRLVREHPMLSLILASGIGYILGAGRRPRGDLTAPPEIVSR